MRWSVLAALSAGALWGLTYPLAEAALSISGSYLAFSAELYSITAVIGILHVLVKYRTRFAYVLTINKLMLSLILALLNIASIYLFYVGIHYTDAATLAFIAQLYPVFTMVIDHVLEGTRIRYSDIISVAMYTTGLVLLSELGRLNVRALLAGLGIALIYVLYIVLYNKLCNSSESYLEVNTPILVFTALISWILMIASGHVEVTSLRATELILALAGISYLCYVLEAVSHRDLPPSIVAFALALEPVVAALTELLQGVTMPPMKILGAVLMIAATLTACSAGGGHRERTTIRTETSSIVIDIMSTPLDRIRRAYEKMLGLFYRLEDEITGIFVALLCRENYILIGPPGTGKTTLIYTLSKLLNARWFYRQLTKFTDLEELLGPIDIAELLRGRVVRIYANSIVEADLALLDEIFNASSAILNTLLSILNERVVYDGDKVVPVKTWTVYASSNRVPEEEELQALYDRFPLRSFLGYVSPEETEPLIVKGWILRRELDRIEPVATMSDVKKCHEDITSIVYSNLNTLVKHVSPVIAAFSEHVTISNRTRVKAVMYVVSYIALTTGSLNIADPSILRVATVKIAKYLVNTKEQLAEYYTFMKAYLPEEFVQIYELINEARALINNLMFDKAREKVEEIELLLSELKTKWGTLIENFFRKEVEEIETTLTRLREAVTVSEPG